MCIICAHFQVHTFLLDQINAKKTHIIVFILAIAAAPLLETLTVLAPVSLRPQALSTFSSTLVAHYSNELHSDIIM